MIRKKYSRDYQTETVLIKGGKKTVVSYTGPYYRFAAPEATVKRMKAVFSVLSALSTGIWLAMLLQNVRLQARSWMLLFPLVFCAPVVLYELMGLWRLLTAKQRVTREHSDKLFDRLRAVGLIQSALGVLTLAGAIAMTASNPFSARSLLLCIGAAIWAGCGAARFVLSRHLKMEPEEA